jgi:AhpD family alkylhydroperoxidase
MELTITSLVRAGDETWSRRTRAGPGGAVLTTIVDRPKLTLTALRRWLPALARRAPYLFSAYFIPRRVAPRLREATMLGVASVNRCAACDRVHQRWARATGLATDDLRDLAPDEAAAHAYGRAIAATGPHGVRPPPGLNRRHRRELEAAGIAMELANLAGNRLLPERVRMRRLQIGGIRTARLYDVAMRLADRAGFRQARARIAGGASGRVLEIGIGTGLNLSAYPPDASLHGIDPSGPALTLAGSRADQLALIVALEIGDAAAMPYPNGTFDVVVGTFVLCSVRDVAVTLRECRRVLRPGGSLRFLEHARSDHRSIARLQGRLAMPWARVSGGCRLDHDVRAAIEGAGFRVVDERSRAGGLLLEIIAAA